MRKKRKVRRLRPAPFLVLIFVFNTLIGLGVSHITSIVRVRAVGVQPADQARISGILEGLRDIPCSRIDSHVVESEVMALPEVDEAEFTRNVFGNALLTVKYKTPVASLAGSETVALSSAGSFYQAAALPADLPTLAMPDGGPPSLVGVAGNWPAQAIAYLAAYAHKTYVGQVIKIEVDSRGVVCLNIGSGRVILGSCDDLDLKLKTLETWLRTHPQELDQVQELNLTTPSMPAVVPKKGISQ